jgi:hypothetical protein
LELSRLAQRRADKWLISGSFLIGTAAPGIFGLPLFLRGVWLLRRALRDGLAVCADVRFAGVVFPVVGWWLYDIFYITPFLAIPYLHTVNREIFSD